MKSLRERVGEVAARIGADADDLWHVIWFESKANPRAKGPLTDKGTRGHGLIQFMPATAKGLGVDHNALLNMTAEEQLPYVEAYFKDIADRNKLKSFTTQQLYASVMAGNPFASPKKGDGYWKIGDVVKLIKERQAAEGGKRIPDTLGRLFGPKPKEADVTPLLPTKKEEQQQDAGIPLMIRRPEVSEGVEIPQDPTDRAQDAMNEAVAGLGEEPAQGKDEEEERRKSTEATWKFLFPDKPMPEGWEPSMGIPGLWEELDQMGKEAGANAKRLEERMKTWKRLGDETLRNAPKTTPDWARKYR